MWPGVQNIIHNLLWEISFRVIILASVCLIQLTIQPRTYHITESELLTHYKRPRHDSYVTPWQMVFITVIIPSLFIYIIFLAARNYVDTIQTLLAWTLAMTLTAVLTETLKLAVGRPRPDFFYRCFPNGKITPGLICTGNLCDVLEGKKSFPSGHSSFSFCSLGFLSLSMCGKLKVLSNHNARTRRSWKVLLCVVPLIGAGAVGWSRYCDNHHHLEDILAGAILGLALSYVCYQQYYHPLTSQRSGEPLTTVTESELYESYQMECCTRSLDDDLFRMFDISDKSSFESNKLNN